jgi:hypothetical protein
MGPMSRVPLNNNNNNNEDDDDDDDDDDNRVRERSMNHMLMISI